MNQAEIITRLRHENAQVHWNAAQRVAEAEEDLKACRDSVATFCRILEVDTDVEGWAKCEGLMTAFEKMTEEHLEDA